MLEVTLVLVKVGDAVDVDVMEFPPLFRRTVSPTVSSLAPSPPGLLKVSELTMPKTAGEPTEAELRNSIEAVVPVMRVKAPSVATALRFLMWNRAPAAVVTLRLASRKKFGAQGVGEGIAEGIAGGDRCNHDVVNAPSASVS